MFICNLRPNKMRKSKPVLTFYFNSPRFGNTFDSLLTKKHSFVVHTTRIALAKSLIPAQHLVFV